jgi:hypothetical protein
MRWHQASRFDLHGRAVGQHLGDAFHDLVGVVAHGDDGVGPHLGRMGHQQVVGFLAGRLGQVDVDRQLAAEDRLDRAAEIADHAARADGDAPHQAQMGDDAIAGQIVGGGDEHGQSP